MKPIHILFACLILPTVALGQSSNTNPDSSGNDTNLGAEVKALREALSQTQKQMAAQQREIETLKAQSKNAVTARAPSELPSRDDGAAGDPPASPLEPTTVSADASIQQQPLSPQVHEKTK